MTRVKSSYLCSGGRGKALSCKEIEDDRKKISGWYDCIRAPHRNTHFHALLSLCHSEVSTWIQSNPDMCWIWMNMFFKEKWRTECSAVEKLVLFTAVLHFLDWWIKQFQILLRSSFISAEWDLSPSPSPHSLVSSYFLPPSFQSLPISLS